MSDNIKAVPTTRVSALEGIRAAISDFIKGAQRKSAQNGGEEATDRVSLSPEAKGVPPDGAKLTTALRDLEMSRYRAAASAQAARAADAQVAGRTHDVKG